MKCITRLGFERLVDLDRPPDSAHVDVRAIAHARGRSIFSVSKHAKERLLPAPSVLGRRMTRWNVRELRRSLAVSGSADYAA